MTDLDLLVCHICQGVAIFIFPTQGTFPVYLHDYFLLITSLHFFRNYIVLNMPDSAG